MRLADNIRGLVEFALFGLVLLRSLTIRSAWSAYVLYSVFRIIICLFLFCFVRGCLSFLHLQHELALHFQSWCNRPKHQQSNNLETDKSRRIIELRRRLNEEMDFVTWRAIALELDRIEGHDQWKALAKSSDYDHALIQQIIRRLKHLQQLGAIRDLAFTLQSLFSRNFCSLNNTQLYSRSHIGTKFTIELFYQRVIESLWLLCRAVPPALMDSAQSSDDVPETAAPTEPYRSAPVEHRSTVSPQTLSWASKLRFLQRARKSYGRTALCLSGGGAFAMLHVGVIKTLLANNCLPSVINGTSGGAIIAGVLAYRTDAELVAMEFLDENISTRYGKRWLPTLGQQMQSFLNEGVLMRAQDFESTCKVYYGERMTFAEGYRRTKRSSTSIEHDKLSSFFLTQAMYPLQSAFPQVVATRHIHSF